MKVLHIGGSTAVHVIDELRFLDKRGVHQYLLSYNLENRMPEYLKKKIPTYYLFDFKKEFGPGHVKPGKQKKLMVFAKRIMNKIRPDIIHVHCPSYCAVAALLCYRMRKTPMLITLWGVPDISINSVNKKRIKKLTECCTYMNAKNVNFLRYFCKFYGMKRGKGIISGYPIRLSGYVGHVPDYSLPRVYIPRSYFQDMIVYAIRDVLKAGRDFRVTLHVPSKTRNKILSLIHKLGIEDKFDYVYKMLPQEAFIENMKKHNILISISSDPGTSATTVQGAFSGMIVLSHHSPYSHGILDDNVNVIKCAKTVKSISKKLRYAIDNLGVLGPKFHKNNKKLIKFDAECSIDAIMNTYKKMVGG
ncbi:MAG: glycosyltransferase [Candidatus Paceibacterota bacterium]